jgi:hypothetical protein
MNGGSTSAGSGWARWSAKVQASFELICARRSAMAGEQKDAKLVSAHSAFLFVSRADVMIAGF